MKPTTLSAFILVLMSTCVSAQSLAKPKDMTFEELGKFDRRYNVSGNCSTVQRDEVFDIQVKYLWFNENSITEYSRLLEDIITKYPEEKFDQINLRWKSGDRVHPFRVLDSSGSDSKWIPIDKEDRQDQERSVLELGNGFSAGKAFQLTVDRTHSEFVSRLAISMSGTDVQLASALYSTALRYYRCYGFEFDNIFLDRTDISVENEDLVFVTRLPRGSIYKLLPKEPQ